ncbi:hypothetical protein F5Y15DRAFT_249472 [Xylariaceae sp. FL0016]|nr:hypothetical protein F5Y15DRAFT_249472 [Xylariaceae sp. FL0016]
MQNDANISDEATLRAPGPSTLSQEAPQVPAPATATADAALHPALLKPGQSFSQAHVYTSPGSGTQSHIHPHLRAPLSTSPSDMMQRAPSPPSDEAGPVSGSPPGMAAQGLLGPEGDDSVTDGRKAKRELSQSKRAAQNRAAQRAFRQRKEHYIKKLEQQVRDFAEMEHAFKAVQNDNYALREYVVQLQSRLLDLQVELPQPPPNVNITPPVAAPGSVRHPHTSASSAEHSAAASSAGTLADVAAAVAGLRAREPSGEATYAKQSYKQEPSEDTRTADEIRRQLQQDTTLPPPSSLRA